MSPKKVYMCRQHETLDCSLKIAQAVIKLMSQTFVTTERYPFIKFLARGGYLFLIDICMNVINN